MVARGPVGARRLRCASCSTSSRANSEVRPSAARVRARRPRLLPLRRPRRHRTRPNPIVRGGVVPRPGAPAPRRRRGGCLPQARRLAATPARRPVGRDRRRRPPGRVDAVETSFGAVGRWSRPVARDRRGRHRASFADAPSGSARADDPRSAASSRARAGTGRARAIARPCRGVPPCGHRRGADTRGCTCRRAVHDPDHRSRVQRVDLHRARRCIDRG